MFNLTLKEMTINYIELDDPNKTADENVNVLLPHYYKNLKNLEQIKKTQKQYINANYIGRKEGPLTWDEAFELKKYRRDTKNMDSDILNKQKQVDELSKMICSYLPVDKVWVQHKNNDDTYFLYYDPESDKKKYDIKTWKEYENRGQDSKKIYGSFQ